MRKGSLKRLTQSIRIFLDSKETTFWDYPQNSFHIHYIRIPSVILTMKNTIQSMGLQRVRHDWATKHSTANGNFFWFYGLTDGSEREDAECRTQFSKRLLDVAKSWGTKQRLLGAFLFPVVRWMLSILQTLRFLLFTFLLEYSCFTMLYYFLWFSKVNQSSIYIYPSGGISFSFRSQQSPESSSPCYPVDSR